MEGSKVIPVGEKLKMLRDKYGLNQDEIVGTDVTRNLISQIENGKAKLTRNTAEIIMTHVKEKLEMRNIPLDVDIEYLMESEDIQARKILDEYIEALNTFIENKDNGFIGTLNEAEEFMLKWNFIDKKITICELAGDYFYNSNDFSKASVYYENTKCLMNVNMVTLPLINVLQKLSNSYYFLGKYVEGINVCNYGLDRFPEMSEELKVGFLFNIGLYYNYLKEYDKAMEFIDKLLKTFDKSEGKGFAQILLLKASCLYHLKQYDEALKTYDDLLSITDSEDYGNRALYYNNLAEIHMDRGILEQGNECLKKSLELIPSITKDFYWLPQVHLETGKRYIQLQEHRKAITYLKQTLSLAKEFKYATVIVNSLLELLHIPEDNLDLDIKKEFFDFLSIYGEVNNLLLINVLQYFAASNDNKSIMEICSFCEKYAENN